jgi:hypothetical protein
VPKVRNCALSLATLLAAGGLLAATVSSRAADPAAGPEPVQLKQSTLDAFDRYMRLTEARNDEELRRGTPFLWVDGLPEVQRKAAYAELRAGQVKMARLETREAGRPVPCPGGLIHHWVGVVFIPGATLPQTLRLLQDYDNHAVYYKPDVQRSKILERQDNDFKVFLRFRRKKIITVVLNTEHEIHYFLIDATRAHSRSRTTRIAEVENHDKPDERENPVGDDGGYLWRMNTYWRFLEQDGGTYVQCEAISLTRDIPAGLGWLIRPFVTSIPRETLTATLNATRAALRRNSASAAR